MSAHRDDGFALASLILTITIVSIALVAALPAYKMQAQRELEAELIFRGEEYVRAIEKYQRKFGSYPFDVAGLLNTNGFHFLRKEYSDPLTGAAFRLLTLNPDGTIGGSRLNSLGVASISKSAFRTETNNGSRNQDTGMAVMIGVGVNKTGKSIRVYKGHDNYSEWEFIVESLDPTSGNKDVRTGK